MLASIVTFVVIAVLVLIAVRSYIKQRKKGCSGNCINCPSRCSNKDN